MNLLTVADVARRLGGDLVGEGKARVTGVAGLREARAGEIAFLGVVGASAYEREVSTTAASAVLVPAGWSGPAPCDVIRVANPEAAITLLAVELAPPPAAASEGVHPTAVVDSTAVLGERVSIGPHCVVEAGVRIGSRTVLGAGCYLGRDSTVGEDGRLYPHVSVREYVRIGNRAILHSGVVIGSDGFGYYPKDGRWEKIPQLGTVEIGDDVEIGANTTVDRARFGRTVIHNGVKIDNLVQVAHNVLIGEHTAIASQVGISGSAVVGRHVRIGGQAGMAGHLTVGDGAVMLARSGVIKDVPPGAVVGGFPAVPAVEWHKVQAHCARLPALRKRVLALEQKIGGGQPGHAEGSGEG